MLLLVWTLLCAPRTLEALEAQDAPPPNPHPIAHFQTSNILTRYDVHFNSSRDGPAGRAEDVAWCQSMYSKHRVVLGLSWGSLLKADQAGWKDRQCGPLIFHAVLNAQLGGLSTHAQAVARLDELRLSQYLQSKAQRGAAASALHFFGATAQDVAYEFKYPWHRYICPGSIVLDVGTHNGDSTLPMAQATRQGICLGFELDSNRYLSLEWAVRLNPQLHLVPYNFGVTAEGEARWLDERMRRGARLVPLFPWLQRKAPAALAHVSFIKIDIDGGDKDIVRTFKAYADVDVGGGRKPTRPLFLIEWFLEYRRGGCLGQSNDIWAAAREIGYRVWDWGLHHELASCQAALDHFASDAVAAWNASSDGGPHARKREGHVKHVLKCGRTSRELDLCDLVLAPREMDLSVRGERARHCPPPLSPQGVERLLAQLV